MSQSLKRVAVVFSLVLNIGFLSAAGWVWVKGTTKAATQNIVSQHYEFYHKLDLSAQQDSTVDSLLAAYLKSQDSLRIRLDGLERQLKNDALFADEDTASLTAITSEIGNIRKEQEMLTAKHLRRVRSVLTGVQIEHMNAMLEEFFDQRNNQSK